MTEHSRGCLSAITKHCLLWPTLLIVTLGALLAGLGLDAQTAAYFFDPTTHGFPARRGWWADQVIHQGGRWFVMATLVACLALYAGSFVSRPYRSVRRASLYVICVMLCVQVAVIALQYATNQACPSKLKQYGGELTYLRPVEAFIAPRGYGHCFPGRHSSAGFAYFAFVWVFFARSSRQAMMAAIVALALGGCFALGQWARGAHFPTHDLASTYIAWLVAFALWRWPFATAIDLHSAATLTRPTAHASQ